MFKRAGLMVIAILGAGCGANVVFGNDGSEGGGGSGGGSANTSTGTTNPTSTSTGSTFCTTLSQCGFGSVCLFETGECIPACDSDFSCPDNLVCQPCVTSSCPDCKDCLSGCVPGIQPQPCDSHDDCGTSTGDDVCVFFLGQCAQRCGPGSPPCPPATFCEPCATSSCPACDDCIGACIMGFKE